MKFRFVAITITLLIPLAASADDLSSTQAQAPQEAVGASDLLPQSGNAGGGVSSTGAGSVLQPNASSLQGSTADGSSLSAPSDKTLQAGAANEDLKVFLGGEADGAPKNINDPSTSSLGEDLASVGFGVLVLCIALGVLRRRVARTVLDI
jgi:hypothetical protein